MSHSFMSATVVLSTSHGQSPIMRRIVPALILPFAASAAFAVPMTWHGDPYGSSMLLVFNHSDLIDIPLLASGVSGTTEIDDADGKITRLQVDVDLRSLMSYTDVWPKALQAENMLDVAKTPTLSFTMQSASRNGEGGWTVRGPLTLHGVTRPAEFQLKPSVPHAFADRRYGGVTLTGTLNWRDYGTQYDPSKTEHASLGHGANITIYLELVDKPHTP
ncbi:MAG: YceI family protein [Steroidobacteraceae bacterium]